MKAECHEPRKGPYSIFLFLEVPFPKASVGSTYAGLAELANAPQFKDSEVSLCS